MLLVGLTGGIGSGKSTVARLLQDKGARLVDADVAARRVVEPGRPTLRALAEHFGEEILLPDGGLDRAGLARIAFASEAATSALDAITWPAIVDEFTREIDASPPDAVVLVDAPLLAEGGPGAEREFAAVIVVEAPAEVRLDRLVARGLARDDAQRRMDAQASDDERRQYATYVLDNGGDVVSLSRQVDAVWADLERLLHEERAG
ncbi:MAG TPA: dephospho-CoA kinase [Acidimicrobiia bacterium]|jgi:dephospho-CoA kinase